MLQGSGKHWFSTKYICKPCPRERKGLTFPILQLQREAQSQGNSFCASWRVCHV